MKKSYDSRTKYCRHIVKSDNRQARVPLFSHLSSLSMSKMEGMCDWTIKSFIAELSNTVILYCHPINKLTAWYIVKTIFTVLILFELVPMPLTVYIPYHVPHQLLQFLCHLNSIPESSSKFRYLCIWGTGNTLLQNAVSNRVADMCIWWSVWSETSDLQQEISKHSFTREILRIL